MPAPVCPRCSYDLRGEAATWQHSCPLRGTCSECGLDLSWPDIFRARATSRWYLEDGRPHPRRWLLTSLATHRPPLLWREANGRLHSRTPRLLAFAAPWLLALHAGVYLLAITRGHNYTVKPPRFAESAPLWLWPYKARYDFPVAGRASTWRSESLIGTTVLTAGFWLLAALWTAALTRLRAPRVPLGALFRPALLSAPLVFLGFWIQAAALLLVTYINARHPAMPDGALYAAFFALTAAWPITLCLWWQQALAHHARHPKASHLALGEFLLSIVTLVGLAILTN